LAAETDRTWFAGRLLQHLGNYLLVSPSQIDLLYDHFRLLMLWNERINLSAIRSPEEIVLRHYCESLFFAARMPEFGPMVADIGSGAGFPGVPTAILHPEWSVTLIESHQRKAVFLRESTREIPNLAVIDRRVEQLSRGFDSIISRAVRPAEVVGLLPEVAVQIGLLLSRSDFIDIDTGVPVDWISCHSIPWSDNNLCVFGSFHVEQ